MTKEEFFILNNLYEASSGRAQNRAEHSLARAGKLQSVFLDLQDKNLINRETGEITDAGLDALAPYQVDSAVILAAGSATRFIPLSLEQPKGLYEVYGERLIERQIRQLQDAGIDNITVVLGYKKEMFSYLAEKYGVTLLFNPAYNVKNNIESILVAKEAIRNTYICVCDCYYVANPFHKYEYRTSFAGVSISEKKAELYVRTDSENRIYKIDTNQEEGKILIGHSYWQEDFSKGFLKLAEEHRKTGLYDDRFWEWLWNDYMDQLPPMYLKEYAREAIYEFDYFEQLREFDVGYVSRAHSDILRNIKLVFRCDEEDIVDFRTVSEGLTNTSFIFQIDGVDYIYRHPGEGTEKIINRRNEKTSLIKAKQFGIDPTYIYMDVLEGWKISRFITDFREPDYFDPEDSKKIVDVLRKLHAAPIQVNYGMRPWEDALTMERLLKENDPLCFTPYEDLKKKIETLYQKTRGDGIEKCFCHGDTYKPNWMIVPDGNVILIDWEYAGISDPGIDVGYYIVDAMYDFEDAKQFIALYLKGENDPKKKFHYLAYTAIIAYYWFVWALYRESCGAVMGESLHNWHQMAEKYANWLVEKEGETS